MAGLAVRSLLGGFHAQAVASVNGERVRASMNRLGHAPSAPSGPDV